MPIELDAKNRIFMPDQGPGNRPRFAEFFRQVWTQISREQKDRILTFWRKYNVALPIDLVEGHRYPGENEDYGCRVTFNAQAVDWAPDDKLACLIAHELGHVLSYADPESASKKATGSVNIERLNKIKEEEADARAESWGFDMTALRKWGNDNLGQFQAFGCDMPDGFTY